MQPLDLLILNLATFYVAYAISSTHGPWNCFDRLRQRLPLGGLLACFVCMSIWVAVLVYVIYLGGSMMLIYPFAIAGGVVFLWRWTGADHV